MEHGMKTSIATVSLSGSLVEKLHACAAAGFDGVEIFEPDLIASDHSPEEIRAPGRPARAVAGPLPTAARSRGRRRDRPSPTTCAAPAPPSPPRTARHRHRPGVQQCRHGHHRLRRGVGRPAAPHRRPRAGYGIRIAFEALAWGRYVDDYRRAWRIVELADHPAVGVCLDSFHVLSRGHDPAAIEQIPGDKIFYLQLADAPALTMDVLSWSRHHRLFPGEGTFDLAGVRRHTCWPPATPARCRWRFSTTPSGRPIPVHRRARAAIAAVAAGPARTLDPVSPMPKPPTGFDFVEIKAEDTSEVEVLLGQLGFTPRGRHRTKPVSLWAAGEARVVLNEQQARDQVPHVAAIGLQVPDADATSRRAAELMAPVAYRRTYAAEQPFGAAVAPDGTEFFWITESAPVRRPGSPNSKAACPSGRAPVQRIDHVNLTQPWQTAEDAVLFLTSVFGLTADAPAEVPGPTGLVRSQVMRNADGAVRLPLNVAPHVLDGGEPAAARRVRVHRRHRVGPRRAGRRAAVPDGPRQLLRLPGRPVRPRRRHRRASCASSTCSTTAARPHGGHFVHFYTRTVGSVFFEFVQRFGDYDGYGVDNAPVRLAAQRGGVGTVRS